jgi:copper chaperone CopZ
MTTLRIENMHCAACIRRVTQALNALPDAKVEEVQLGAARLETTASPAEILAALQKTGFPTQIEP